MKTNKAKLELTLEEAWGWNHLMATSAVRYCLGRQTYMVGACCDWIISSWDKFPPNVKQIIQRDVEIEFERDDEERADPNFKYTYTLGNNCDRAEWERVRALWLVTAQEAALQELTKIHQELDPLCGDSDCCGICNE